MPEQQTERQTEIQTGRQAGRQTDRQTDRQADRQVDRQTDRWTPKLKTPRIGIVLYETGKNHEIRNYIRCTDIPPLQSYLSNRFKDTIIVSIRTTRASGVILNYK